MSGIQVIQYLQASMHIAENAIMYSYNTPQSDNLYDPVFFYICIKNGHRKNPDLILNNSNDFVIVSEDQYLQTFKTFARKVGVPISSFNERALDSVGYYLKSYHRWFGWSFDIIISRDRIMGQVKVSHARASVMAHEMLHALNFKHTKEASLMHESVSNYTNKLGKKQFNQFWDYMGKNWLEHEYIEKVREIKGYLSYHCDGKI